MLSRIASQAFAIFLFTAGASAASSASSIDKPTLEEKLTHQFVRYGEARQQLLERLKDYSRAPEERRVERVEWESWLTPIEPYKITEADIKTLQSRQRWRIKAAHRRAILESVIDLDQLRKLPAEQSHAEIESFCAAIPKGGMLHVHPAGTLTRETGKQLLTTRNPVMPLLNMTSDFMSPEKGMLLYPDELQWLRSFSQNIHFSALHPADQAQYLDLLVLPPGNHPFERFDSVFAFVKAAIKEWDDYEKAFLVFSRRAVTQGVSYVEFRFSFNPEFYPKVVKMLERIESETGLIVRIDWSFNRTVTKGQLETDLFNLMSLPANKWVVGIDLLGNERMTPALETSQKVYGTVLQAVLDGQSQLGRTMHAGEIGDGRDPRDAMIMGSERLGHAVLLAEDPVALEYAVRHKVPVEVNLVSNVRLQAVGSMLSHPFLDYLRLGLPVSLSTDDEGIFETDINNECVLAIEESDVTYAELKQMARNSLATAFLQTAEKERLQRQLEEKFMVFEQFVRQKAEFQRAAGF